MEKLTSKEQLVLQKIKEFLSEWQKITVRALQSALSYASPRSISVLLDKLIEKWWIYRDVRDHICIAPSFERESASVLSIPLVGAIACGMPIFAEENIETSIPVSIAIVSPWHEYFFLRADGDSMDKKWVNDGDLILIQKTSIARDGQIVVALINDEATLKEFRTRENSVFLLPHSTNPRHVPIILDSEEDSFSIQWIFVRSFPGNLFS